MDAVATMGSILPKEARGRDAVHVAVLSAVADEVMYPGEHVGINGTIKEGEYVAYSQVEPSIGIVDPFINGVVQKGERFWLFLYPRTITGLSHQWSHPAFDGAGGSYSSPASKLASERWLRDFCNSSNLPGYHAVMNAVENNRYRGESLSIYGNDASGDIPREFWDHVENVLGEKIPEDEKAEHFSCSC